MHDFFWLVLVLPLAAAIIVGLLGKRLQRDCAWIVVVASAAACAVAISGFLSTYDSGSTVYHASTESVRWFSAGGVDVKLRLVMDPISATMLTAITFVGTWIAIFSVGYMHGDPGYPRFFAVLSGFLFSMCGLVLTDNLLVLYAFWEGVGICSYFLIGFWFAKPEAAAAARKAFLVTRLGDVGFLLGIFLLWTQWGTVSMPELFHLVRNKPNEAVLTTACLLLFCGAVGKSAQFPLHVWLPDAMEGPTPASALIHAATMVTAGVYLVARCMPMFVVAPAALVTVAIIGSFTALLAALIALTQHDLKRVMAYSTVSQLGLMFAALGSGHGNLATLAVIAAIFHLFTHAFFKALLFLASGSVMHAMGGVIDMRRFGGLRKVMPITHVTFAFGAFALAGLPPLSGFWSKDEILAVAREAGHHSPYPILYLLVFASLLLTSLLTAFYTSRAYFRTFWGPEKIPHEAGSHGHFHDEPHEPADEVAAHHHAPVAHESPAVMTIPLFVLALGAIGIGAVLAYHHIFATFINRGEDVLLFLKKHEPHPNVALMALSGIASLVGIATAWFLYVARPAVPAKMAAAVPGLYRASQNRFYVDELYGWIAVGPLAALAVLSRIFDLLVDGVVDLVGRLPKLVAGLLRPLQNGLVQFYALAMLLALTVLLGVLIWNQ